MFAGGWQWGCQFWFVFVVTNLELYLSFSVSLLLSHIFIVDMISLTTVLPHSLVLLFWYILWCFRIVDLRQAQGRFDGALLVSNGTLGMHLGQELLDASGEGLCAVQQLCSVKAYSVPSAHEIALMSCAQSFLKFDNQLLLLLSFGTHQLRGSR